MAEPVATQVDVGGLTLHGLSSFSKMLATFSADDVAPTAMIQMELLGSRFLTSGKHADKVPDLLQRYSSVQLDRLAFTVGWRKGDSASIMANSAGGQAIALLSLALGSIYYGDDLGNIFKGLSERLLSESVAIASVSQLASVGERLRGKLAPLAFGNHAAQRVVRIYKMYESLGRAAPTNLLNKVSVEAMIDLLECVSRSLLEKQSVIRFYGTYSAGYTLSIVSMLFPHDTLVTLEGIVVEEGIRQPPSIIFELGQADDGSTEMCRLEVYLEHSNGLKLPIMVQENSPSIPSFQTGSFEWDHWIADSMVLEFAPFGLNDIKGILQASCNLLLALVIDPSWHLQSPDSTSPGPPLRNRGIYIDITQADHQRIFKFLRTSLSSHSARRVSKCCQIFTGVYPSTANPTVVACYSDLRQLFCEITEKLDCLCENSHCWLSLVKGFGPEREDLESLNTIEYFENEYTSCPKCVVWRSIGYNINAMFWSLFVDIGDNTVAPRGLARRACCLSFLDNVLWLFDKEIFEPDTDYYGRSIHENMLEFLGDTHAPYALTLGLGLEFQVVVPSRLLSLSLEREPLIRYTVLEGSFMMKGHHYVYLTNNSSAEQRTKIDHDYSTAIVPSNAGIHSSLLVTIRERMEGLELKATIRMSKIDYTINLLRAINASYQLKMAIPCMHDPVTQLDPQLSHNVRAISVTAAKFMDQDIVSVVMTRGNAEAELLACRENENMLLARQCCLNCAYHQLMHDPDRVPKWPSRIIL
ncbi:hypothetical protein MMC10_010145 [Thelotrema lepadinum]|nr:hypothetical protein [Thelotrema lepadinum]